MEKRRINLYVNDRSYQTVRKFLLKSDQSFSGWLAAMLDEMAKEIEGQPTMLGKPLGDLTLNEFSKLMEYWLEKARGIK